jgi:hypothetical protein
MRTWHWRSGASLAAIALLGLAAVGTATSSAAVVRPATTLPYFKFVNYNGKCLDAANGSGTGKVQQWGCNSNLWQYWAVYSSGHGAGFLVQNYWTGRCLAADGDTPGSTVVQQACNPSSRAQNWLAPYTGAGGWYEYISAQVTGGCNATEGQPCGMHPCGASSQDGKGICLQLPNAQNNLHSFYWELGAQL